MYQHGISSRLPCLETTDRFMILRLHNPDRRNQRRVLHYTSPDDLNLLEPHSREKSFPKDTPLHALQSHNFSCLGGENDEFPDAMRIAVHDDFG